MIDNKTLMIEDIQAETKRQGERSLQKRTEYGNHNKSYIKKWKNAYCIWVSIELVEKCIIHSQMSIRYGHATEFDRV